VIPAEVTADELKNLNHLSRARIAPEALTRAGDGDPNRVAQEVVAALTHPGFVEAVALHPKGKILASAGNDRTVRLWDLAGAPPKELVVLRNHTATVGRLAFTADGTHLVSGAVDGTVIVWRLPTEGAPSAVQQFNTVDPVTAIGASPASHLVALGCAGGSVRVFNVETGAGGEVVRGNRSSGVNSAMFTDNDRKLIVGSNGLLRQIDLADGNEELWNLAESKVRFAALAASPDRNRFLANGYGYAAGERPGAMVLFPGLGNNQDLERQYSLSVRALTGEPITQKKLRHDGQVVRAAWTPDGQQIVALTDDSQLHVWNWAAEIKFGQSLKLAHENVGHHVLCRDVVLHPDGRHAIVSRTNGQILIVRFKQK
jgi:WD40 repeat protein